VNNTTVTLTISINILYIWKRTLFPLKEINVELECSGSHTLYLLVGLNENMWTLIKNRTYFLYKLFFIHLFHCFYTFPRFRLSRHTTHKPQTNKKLIVYTFKYSVQENIFFLLSENKQYCIHEVVSESSRTVTVVTALVTDDDRGAKSHSHKPTALASHMTLCCEQTLFFVLSAIEDKTGRVYICWITVSEWHSCFKAGQMSARWWTFRATKHQQTAENVQKIWELIHKDHRWTIHELADTTGISYGVCQEILTGNLNMCRTAAKFVPRLLINIKSLWLTTTCLSFPIFPICRT
jgi:hypothetical protein